MNERTAGMHMKGNGAASPEDLERDLDRTRSELNHTLDEISHRLSPGQLIDQAMDYFQTGPKEYAMNLGAQIRDNPLPATLAAVGIGWLMYSSHNPPEYRYRGYGEEEYTSEGLREGMAEKGRSAYGSAVESMHEMSERISGKRSEMKARMGKHVGETREGMAKASESMKRRAHSMASGVRDSGYAARDSFSDMLHDQPLLLGVMAIAVGIGLGAAFPPTKKERETMGPTRDEMMRRVRETGREEIEKTKEEMREVAAETSPSRPH